jgi:hypothetical protein
MRAAPDSLGGTMRRFRKNIWRTLKGMVLAFATAAVVTATAGAALPAGELPQGYAPAVESELTMIEGGDALLRAGLTFDYGNTGSYVGVSQPDGYQPQTKAIEAVTVSASDDGFQLGDAAVGLGLALVLAAASGIALGLARGRIRTAH